MLGLSCGQESPGSSRAVGGLRRLTARGQGLSRRDLQMRELPHAESDLAGRADQLHRPPDSGGEARRAVSELTRSRLSRNPVSLIRSWLAVPGMADYPVYRHVESGPRGSEPLEAIRCRYGLFVPALV